MFPVIAEQLIFARVERKFSPRNSPGFQTVHRSEGISKDEQTIVESVVRLSPPGPSGQVRRQVFEVGNDSVAIVQSIHLSPDAEIVDRQSRPAWVSHAVVLTSRALSELQGGPFQIFSQVEFVTQAAEFRDRFQPQQEIIPQLELQNTINRQHESDGWTDQTRSLYQLALKAQDMIPAGEYVQLTGTEVEVFASLQKIYGLALELQGYLWFDTNTDGRQFAKSTFWAVGMPGDAVQSRLPTVDCANRNVVRGLESTQMPDSTDHQWLSQEMETKPPAKFTRDAEYVRPAAEALDNGIASESEIPPEALIALGRSAPDRVDGLLRTRLSKLISEHLATAFVSRMSELLAQRHQRRMADWVRVAIDPVSEESLVADFFTIYLMDSHARVGANDRKVIYGIASRTRHTVLQFWCIASVNSPDVDAMRSVLEQMSDEEFSDALIWMNGTIQVERYVSVRHGRTLAKHINVAELSDRRFVKLAHAFLLAGAGSSLGSWVERTRKLSGSFNKTLAEHIRQQSDCAASLRNVVLHRDESSGS